MKKQLAENIKLFLLGKGFKKESLELLEHDQLVNLAKEHHFLPQ
jgi:hypothetical protein